jgi:hypothetical protein
MDVVGLNAEFDDAELSLRRCSQRATDGRENTPGAETA